MSAKISIFKKSALNLKGKLTLHGYFDNLNYGGDLKISNLSIPELLLTLRNAELKFKGQEAIFKISLPLQS